MAVALCFFLSGAAALVLQVLWTRMLGHVFGATALAISTTLTVFMGGLALGSHLGGRVAPRLRRPLLAFAALESAVGLYGLLVPSLLDAMPAVQSALGVASGAGFVPLALARFALVTAVLIVPTTAMGATLPILAQAVVQGGEGLAARVGRLYAANTAGAVLGAFSAGFVLIPGLGLTATVYLAAAVDLAVALAVLGLFRAGGSALLVREREARSPDEVLAALAPVEVVPIGRGLERLVLATFALSGAAAMALEVFWTRTVGVVIGASTYSFTLILTTFLVGLAAGAALASRRVERLRDPVRALAWVQALIGLTATLATLLGDRLPLWLHASAQARDLTTAGLHATSMAITAAVTLPTTLLLGAVMPLVVRVLSARSSGEEAGPLVGRAYALNTVGAIAGSFLAGFVVLPGLGVERGLGLAAGTSLALALVLVAARRLPAREAAPIAAVALAGAAIVVFAPRWDVRAWTAGLFRMYLARTVYADGWSPSGEVLFHRDGVATTVTVERSAHGPPPSAPDAADPEVQRGHGISLKVNGKVDASDIGDMPTQVLSGLLPVMMHAAPRDVLVIGYGSGVTPGAVLTAPVRTLDVAEIEAGVYEAANTHFAHVNRRPHLDPRCRLVVDDGRNFLLTRDDRFDVIISEPSNPWMSGAASLFTRDFFEVALRRLEDDGIFLQWLQLYELAPRNIHALIRTFRAVFPHVVVFTPDPSSNDTFLVGSRRPLTLERARVEALMATPRARADLARAEIHAPEDLFGLFILAGQELDRMVGDGPLNTDDNALIEFAAPRDLLDYSRKDARLPFLEASEGRRLELAPGVLRGFDLDGPGLVRVAERLVVQGRYADARAFAEAGRAAGGDPARVLRLLRHAEGPEDQPVVVADARTRGDAAYARAVYLMTEDREEAAVGVLDAERDLERRGPAHALLYAFLAYRADRLLDAEYLVRLALADELFVASHPATLFYAARILHLRGRYREASELLARFDDAELAAGVGTSTTAP